MAGSSVWSRSTLVVMFRAKVRWITTERAVLVRPSNEETDQLNDGLKLRRATPSREGLEKTMNDIEMMQYLVVTMEEVAKGAFTPRMAAEEVMSAILDRELAPLTMREELARKRAS